MVFGSTSNWKCHLNDIFHVLYLFTFVDSRLKLSGSMKQHIKLNSVFFEVYAVYLWISKRWCQNSCILYRFYKENLLQKTPLLTCSILNNKFWINFHKVLSSLRVTHTLGTNITLLTSIIFRNPRVYDFDNLFCETLFLTFTSSHSYF